jgi:hypothetical protein
VQLIGHGWVSLDVECGYWAPASEPSDEICCGPRQYGSGAAVGTECPFVAIGRADDQPTGSGQVISLISHQRRDRLGEVVWSAVSKTVGRCEVVVRQQPLELTVTAEIAAGAERSPRDSRRGVLDG